MGGGFAWRYYDSESGASTMTDQEKIVAWDKLVDLVEDRVRLELFERDRGEATPEYIDYLRADAFNSFVRFVAGPNALPNLRM
jgi:hypothetical protein